MIPRCGRGTLLNCYKFKRRFEGASVKLFFRCNSSGLRILFFGTDDFSLPSLEKLNEERQNGASIQSLEVVTSYKKPKNPVLKYAECNQLSLHKWPIEYVNKNICDLGIVVSFGHLIPQKIISSCRLGIINVHASLLPRWRGAAPIIYALKHGDKKTGVTIMKIEPKHFDVGDILAQKVIEIHDTMYLPELHRKMAEEGANLLVSTVKRYPGILSEAKPQEHKFATYAPKVTQKICNINWSNMTAIEVYNLYRALYSFKNLITKWQTQTIKLVEIRQSCHINEQAKPGFVEFIRSGKYLRVYCTNGACIEVLKICLEGRKTITAVDFNNGFLKSCAIEKRYFIFEAETLEPVRASKQNQ